MTIHIDEMTSEVDAGRKRRARPRAAPPGARRALAGGRAHARSCASASRALGAAHCAPRASMTELFASAAPVFKVDGEVKGELARDVAAPRDRRGHRRHEERSALRLVAQGPTRSGATEELLYLDGRTVDFGKRLEVSIGPDRGARASSSTAWSARIEAAFSEGRSRRSPVFAEDKLMKLRMTRRMKTYENMSDADIAEAIAGEHGLSADVDADGPTYDVVQQWNQSDLAFLRERARLIQAEVWFEDDKLLLQDPRQAHRHRAHAGAGQRAHRRAAARADLAHQRTHGAR